MPVNASNNNLGWIAPEFNLLDISGKLLSSINLKGQNGTVIVFICNHCPYVIAIAERLSEEATQLKKISINTIAIMPNDVIQNPQDSFENMKIFAKKFKFDFPYLFDETQEVAKAYDAACTPDFFLFNSDLRCVYRGRFDSARPKSTELVTGRDIRNAIDATVGGLAVKGVQIPSVGCNIKWRS